MALTKEQKQVINMFKKKYFEVTPIPVLNKISIADFMDKTTTEQIEFVKTWVQEQHTNLITVENNLTAQQNRVAVLKEAVRKALEDWGIFV